MTSSNRPFELVSVPLLDSTCLHRQWPPLRTQRPRRRSRGRGTRTPADSHRTATAPIANTDNKRWSLTCGGTRWSRLVARVFCGVASLTSERTTLIARGRPALPRCTDSRSGDKMMIGCRSQCVCDRSVFRGRPAEGAGGRLHSGADRKHLRDEGQARWMRCDQAAAAITSSSAGASMGASASSPSSRRMWYARRQSLRATDRQARLWSIRCATCR